MGVVKNALKKILPPPVNSFMREVNRIVALEEKNLSALDKLTTIEEQNKKTIEMLIAKIEWQEQQLALQQNKLEFLNTQFESVVDMITMLDKDLRTHITGLQNEMNLGHQKQVELFDTIKSQRALLSKVKMEQKIVSMKTDLLNQRNNEDRSYKMSVIIPVHNSEAYLEKCLKSVINQTLKEIQIICVNDASTDKSLEILQRYAQYDERISIIEREKSCAGLARNLGMSYVTSELFTFCDSDDLMSPYACEFYWLTYKTSRNSADVVIGNFAIEESGNIRNQQFECPVDFNMFFDSISVWNRAYKTSFIIDNNISFPESSQGEDRVFLGYVYAAHPKIILVDEKTYTYVKHENSLEKQNNKQAFLQRINCWIEFVTTCSIDYNEDVQKHMQTGIKYIYSKWNSLSVSEQAECFDLFKSFVDLLEWDKESAIFEFIKFTKDEWKEVKNFNDYQMHVQRYVE